jgi:O-antigen/teichoic acid export membrane protein
MSVRAIINHLLADEGSLKQKALRSSVWAFAGNGANQAVALLRMVILARLLAPSDFGVMGVAVMVLGGLDAFSQTGYQAALIQRRGDIHQHLNTVFSIQILRGFLLAGLLYAVAPYIGIFFDNVQAVPVLRAISVSVLINGLSNPATVFFQKELDFKRQVFWNLSDSLGGLLVGTVMALIWRNVWALVGAQIASSIVRVGMSFVVHPYRPRWHIDWALARELTRYGRWVFGTNLLGYLSTNLDLAVVGKILGTLGIGYYQMAYRISNLPATAMSQIFSSVAFPLYAKIQVDIQKLRRVFFLGLDVAVLVGLPLALFFMILAQPLVLLVFGAKWLPAVVGLQVLGIYGFQRMVAVLGGILFDGVGQPASNTKMNLFRFIGLAVLVYPLTRWWGLAGAGLAAVGSLAITLPYWLVCCARSLQLPPGKIVRHVAVTLTLVLLGWGLPLMGLAMLLPVDHLWALALTCAVSFLLYGLLVFHRVKALWAAATGITATA